MQVTFAKDWEPGEEDISWVVESLEEIRLPPYLTKYVTLELGEMKHPTFGWGLEVVIIVDTQPPEGGEWIQVRQMCQMLEREFRGSTLGAPTYCRLRVASALRSLLLHDLNQYFSHEASKDE
jgi:hypothetical protein